MHHPCAIGGRLLFASLVALIMTHVVAPARAEAETPGPRLVAQPGAPITALAVSPDGQTLVTASGEKSAWVWSLTTTAAPRRCAGHTGGITACAISPDGRRVLTGGWDKTARLWDRATGNVVQTFAGHAQRVNAVAFTPDGAQALTGSADATARWWKLETGRESRRIARGRFGFNALAFSPDGQLLLTGSSHGRVETWPGNAGSRAPLRAFDGQVGAISAVAWSPDGASMLIAGDGATIWPAAAARPPDARAMPRPPAKRRVQTMRQRINAAAFSPDGRTVLTGEHDGTARLWDAATGALLRAFAGHAAAVTAVAFLSDGRCAVTGSADGTTRVWETDTGALRCTLVSYADGAWAVFDPAGNFDASNPDGIAQLCWVADGKRSPLSDNKAHYYEPGLLSNRLKVHDDGAAQ